MSVTVWDPKYNFHEYQDCHFNFTSVSSATSMGLAGLTCRNSYWMRLGVLVRVTPVKRWYIQNRMIGGGLLTKGLFPQVRAVTSEEQLSPRTWEVSVLQEGSPWDEQQPTWVTLGNRQTFLLVQGSLLWTEGGGGGRSGSWLIETIQASLLGKVAGGQVGEIWSTQMKCPATKMFLIHQGDRGVGRHFNVVRIIFKLLSTLTRSLWDRYCGDFYRWWKLRD